MRLTLLTTAALAVIISAAPTELGRKPARVQYDPATNITLVALTDKFVFNTSLETFIHNRSRSVLDKYSFNASSAPERKLDWDADGCSSSPDKPFGYPFRPACLRHDFAYRNYKLQNRFTEPNRLKIDNNFHLDLQDICAVVKSKTGKRRKHCRGVAKLYYKAVREFGDHAYTARLVLGMERSVTGDDIQKGYIEEIKSQYHEIEEGLDDDGSFAVSTH